MEFELNTNTNTSLDVSSNDEITRSARVYRFKFDDDFINKMSVFSKIHQYDDRVGFKEAWTIWMTDNEDSVVEEVERLMRLGYEGDVREKMFKSARYYFRKKRDEKKEPVKRREYIHVPKELLEKMDTHITHHKGDLNYTPKDGFNQFCEDYTLLLKEGITKICRDGITDPDVIRTKMKKTYKNRYFMLTNK